MPRAAASGRSLRLVETGDSVAEARCVVPSASAGCPVSTTDGELVQPAAERCRTSPQIAGHARCRPCDGAVFEECRTCIHAANCCIARHHAPTLRASRSRPRRAPHPTRGPYVAVELAMGPLRVVGALSAAGARGGGDVELRRCSASSPPRRWRGLAGLRRAASDVAPRSHPCRNDRGAKATSSCDRIVRLRRRDHPQSTARRLTLTRGHGARRESVEHLPPAFALDVAGSRARSRRARRGRCASRDVGRCRPRRGVRRLDWVQDRTDGCGVSRRVSVVARVIEWLGYEDPKLQVELLVRRSRRSHRLLLAAAAIARRVATATASTTPEDVEATKRRLHPARSSAKTGCARHEGGFVRWDWAACDGDGRRLDRKLRRRAASCPSRSATWRCVATLATNPRSLRPTRRRRNRGFGRQQGADRPFGEIPCLGETTGRADAAGQASAAPTTSRSQASSNARSFHAL